MSWSIDAIILDLGKIKISEYDSVVFPENRVLQLIEQ